MLGPFGSDGLMKEEAIYHPNLVNNLYKPMRKAIVQRYRPHNDLIGR